jgi:hypothetical protein
LVKITNVPIETARDAETVHTEWRYRPQVENTPIVSTRKMG